MKGFFQNRALKYATPTRGLELPGGLVLTKEDLEKVIIGEVGFKTDFVVIGGEPKFQMPYPPIERDVENAELDESKWFAQFRPARQGKVSYVISPEERKYLALAHTESNGFQMLNSHIQIVPPREAGYVIFQGEKELEGPYLIHTCNFLGREPDKKDSRLYYCKELEYSEIKEMLKSGLE